MKKYTCLYYWLVEPIRNEFLDTSESQPAFEIPIGNKIAAHKFALFVSNNGNPEYARLTMRGLDEEKIPNELLPMILAVKEHLLSILRITYNPEVTLFRLPIWTFLEDISSYTMGLDIQRLTNFDFDIEKAKRLFIGSFPYREEFRLFIDGHDNQIPLQYRYLSLYKIIELHFKEKGQWQEERLEAFLEKYTSFFEEIAVVKKPTSHIHMLRDKCTHIKTGKRKEVFGVTQLNLQEASEVSKIMPIMSDICIEILNERAKGNYIIGKWIFPFGNSA